MGPPSQASEGHDNPWDSNVFDPQVDEETTNMNNILGTGESDPNNHNDQKTAERNTSWGSGLMGPQTLSMKNDNAREGKSVLPMDQIQYEETKPIIKSMNSIQEGTKILRRCVIEICQERGTLDLLSMQTSEGSWPWKEELFSCMGLIPTMVAATMEVQDTESLSAIVAATVVVIRYSEYFTGEDGNLWDAYTSRASSWLAEQTEPSQLAGLLNQAGDLF
ncbi:hypothetical protein BX616_000726 [Lobosporangium transversale]|nr:hypothetical protein BX616_000726 [Lobosporangium transversale]